MHACMFCLRVETFFIAACPLRCGSLVGAPGTICMHARLTLHVSPPPPPPLTPQVVDDILDFTQTSEQLGKPQGQDLASGNLTAPAIFALRSCPELVRPRGLLRSALLCM